MTAREPISGAGEKRSRAADLYRAPLRALPGGILPEEEKHLSRTVPIRTPALPERLVLPLQQHVGAAAEPLVEIGQRVLKGEPLAAARGWVSLPLHAPTSGIIADIGPYPAPHPSGLPAPCIVLEPDGADRWAPLHPVADWRAASVDTLIDAIRAAGIAGLGGAGFPTAVKLSPRPDHSIDTLIVNGAECEPYITADDRLMCERAGEILAGLDIVMHLVAPQRCLIGIEDNKPEAIAALEAAITGLEDDPQRPPIQIVVVPTRYPSGGEKQLIQMLTDREVPSGGLPSDIGMLCINVATAAAVHRAVALGEPVISRITTLTGRALDRPGNFEALIGTPFSHLLAEAGLREAALGRLLMGGPMMGFAIADASVGVVKTTNCILAATPSELPAPPPAQPCIRCGMCEQACPASLLPQQLFWFARDDDFEAARDHDLADCIECGACAWVCPSAIPLVRYYRYAKGELRRQREEAVRAERARERFEFHQARVEAEHEEREARRRARAEAARSRKQQDAAKQTADADAPQAGSTASATSAAVDVQENAPPPDAAEQKQRTDALAARLERAREDLASAAQGDDDERTDRLRGKQEGIDSKLTQNEAAAAQAAGSEASDASSSADVQHGAPSVSASGAAAPGRLIAGNPGPVAGSPAAGAPDTGGPVAPSPTPDPAPDRALTTAQRRAQLETLRARRRQLDADLHGARQSNAPDAVARIASRIEDLDPRIAAREAELAAGSAVSLETQAGPGAATPYADDSDLEQLTAEADRARSRARKAATALTALQAGGADDRKLAAMRASLERLEAAARDAETALRALHRTRGDVAAPDDAPNDAPGAGPP